MTVESLNQYIGRYIHGSLFRKLKKTWIQLCLTKNEDILDFVELKEKWDKLGLCDEEQNKVLLPVEKGCLYMCLAFLNKKNTDIISTKQIKTSPRLGCSRTSMSVNDAHYNLLGKYNPGSLLRKMKIKWLQLKHVDKWVEVNDGLDYVELEKTWVQLGQTDEGQSMLILLEKECLNKCLEFFNKKNKEIICRMDKIQTTKPSLGCSGPSVAVNEGCNNLYGEYSSGSLLRKLRKTFLQLGLCKYEEGLDFMELKKVWDQCGLSNEEQNTRLLQKETDCLRMYMEFFNYKYIIGTKKMQTKTRVGFSGTSMPHEPLLGDYSCGSLLRKLKKTSLQLGLDKYEEGLDFMELKNKWVKNGRSDQEQTVLLLKIEKECLRKCSKFFKQELVTYLRRETQLDKELHDAQLEISTLSSVLGVKSSDEIPDNTLGTIKDLVEHRRSTLIELRIQKQARTKEFLDVLSEIHNISGEIAGFFNLDDVPTVDEYDLSQKKLEGYKSWLQKLRSEKLKESDSQLNHLGNQTDTALEERNLFDNFTCNSSASVDEVATPELRVDMDNQTPKETLSREDMLDEVKKLMSALKPQYTLETIKDKNHEDIMSVLEELKKLKDERRNNIKDIMSQKDNILGEFIGYFNREEPEVFEFNLSQELLEDYQSQVEGLTKEKEERLQKVSNFLKTLHQLCAVLGMDSFSTLAEIHPSLNNSTDGQSKSISDHTLTRLHVKVSRLRKAKEQRWRKLNKLASRLNQLRKQAGTPLEERTLSDNFPSNIPASVDEVTTPGALALDLIKQTEEEVERLESRLKEIASEKYAELEKAARGPKAARDKTMTLINSGCIEQTELRVNMDNQTTKEALSEEDTLLDEVKKLMLTCDESVAGIVCNREESCAGIPDSTSGPIMKKFNAAFEQLLEELRQPKEVRIEDFSDLVSQMHNISEEIDESGLSQTKLEGYQSWFQKLEMKKKERMHKVSKFVNTMHDLCAVLGMDFSSTIAEIHPSLNDSTDAIISNSTLSRLADTVSMLKERKKLRLHKLKELASQLNHLWNQTDTALEVRNLFDNFTCNMSASVDEVTTPGALALDRIKQAEVEVERRKEDKKKRMNKVSKFVNTMRDLCAVLDMDFSSTIAVIHPSLNDSTDAIISNSTLTRLADTVSMLKERKKQRLHKLKELASQLNHLWNQTDTALEERNLFDNFTCNISASVDEVTTPGALALDLINQAEVEVERLGQLKVSRMKEIALKKQAELGEIFAHTHIKIDMDAARERIESSIVSGGIEPTELLVDLDNQIEKAKKDALSRKDILDLVRIWLSACEEERWLEDYYQDENRYNTSTGATNLNMDEEERAKEAWILVNKIPDMVETLVAKTCAWEDTHGIPFTYDGDHLLEKLYIYVTQQMLRNDQKKRSRRH